MSSIPLMPRSAPVPEETVLSPAASEADHLFDAVAAEIAAQRGAYVPRATYRMQLHHEFPFEFVRRQVEYLHRLGISDVYSSPFFRARRGSTHGYDIVDHNALQPAIGEREQLDALHADLEARGMGLVLDIVPNHMGVATADNAWWMDVLENGPSSLYAPFFDIDWAPLTHELHYKVLLPMLGDHYGRVLENGDIRLRFDDGAFFVDVYSTPLPVNPRTYPLILARVLAELVAHFGEEHEAVLELQSILTGLSHLPPRTQTERARQIERAREKQILKRRLAAVVSEVPEVARAVAGAIEWFNGRKGEPHTFDGLDALLEEQAYRLSYWRVAAEEINYRRFFDINDLAAIRMENPAVFQQAHRFLFELLGRNEVRGVRVDHPDGLWNPASYFAALQRGYFIARCRARYLRDRGESADDTAARVRRSAFDRLVPRLAERYDAAVANDASGAIARPLYVVAEKILSRGETLPAGWGVHGTSGYDFTILAGSLFVDAQGERAFTEAYETFIGERVDFERLVYEKKKLILRTSLASELNVLANALHRLAARDRHSRDFTLGSLKDALREVIASFPVYRSYVDEGTASLSDHHRIPIERAVRLARRRNPTTDTSIYSFVRSVLVLDVPDRIGEDDRARYREFVMRFQQLTSPVMAKGLEDTAFYVYNRLVSLNEVGGEPERFGVSIAQFHRANALRQQHWPFEMLTTSTHDTKRSEDVRARISVLSERPAAWAKSVAEWSQHCAQFKTDNDGTRAPDANEEWLLYQTILGSLPFAPTSAEEHARYIDRVVEYMRKATKEAKVNTSWLNADAGYDAAIESFVRSVLDPANGALERMAPLAREVAFHGMWGSLSQTLLRCTAPGVPDLYQGNEIWDFSLVDPDNRRAVDYALREKLLDDVLGNVARGADYLRDLVANASDGRIKMFVIHATLAARARWPEVFGAASTYTPLAVHGEHADHVIAFSRTHGSDMLVTVAARFTAKLTNGEIASPVGGCWRGDRVAVPPGRYTDLFSRATFETRDDGDGAYLALDEVFALAPVALLTR